MVKCYARCINVTGDSALQAELRQHLRSVWPEVLVALQGAGILKAKTFLLGTRLFSYYEVDDTFDPHTGFDAWVLTDEKCVEWNQLMQKYESPVEEADQANGEWWKNMEEVCCFETQFEMNICEPAHANTTAFSNSYMY